MSVLRRHFAKGAAWASALMPMARGRAEALPLRPDPNGFDPTLLRSLGAARRAGGA
jgi:hypothetical protein